MVLRERYLFVCLNQRPDDHPKGSCFVRGAQQVHAALKQELGARGLAKLQARACTSSCLDVCSQGVTILVEPDHIFLGGVTVDDAAAIAEGITSGEFPARLVLSRDTIDRG